MLNKIKDMFKNGLLFQNPSLVLLLGMCPLLATSTSLSNGIGMGLSATAVLICSNTAISLLRKFIPNQIRIAAYVVVIAGFVTIVNLLLEAYLPALHASLGIFIPLIVVNCIILARAEAFASKNSVFDSALDGLTMGLGFTFALIMMSSVRELIGNGTLFNYPVLGKSYEPAILLILPPGGFLTLGFLIAAMQKILSRKKGA